MKSIILITLAILCLLASGTNIANPSNPEKIITQTVYQINVSNSNITFNNFYLINCPVANIGFDYDLNISIVYVAYSITANKQNFVTQFYQNHPDFWGYSSQNCKNYHCSFNITFNASSCFISFEDNLTISYYIYEEYMLLNSTDLLIDNNNSTDINTNMNPTGSTLEIYQIILIALGCLLFVAIITGVIVYIAKKTQNFTQPFSTQRV